jgi:polyisoprenoid-binding protein YceI
MAALPALVCAAPWEIDTAHSSVVFQVRHLGISKVSGSFSNFQGSIDADPANLATLQANVTIDAASISTRNEKRDAHLKSPDFFDVEKFPALTFVGKKVSGVEGSSFKLEGDLTIHGVTKPVVLEATFNGGVKDPQGNERVAFSASTRINRKDFGLTWNKTIEGGGLLVSDEVDIVIDLEAAKKAG